MEVTKERLDKWMVMNARLDLWNTVQRDNLLFLYLCLISNFKSFQKLWNVWIYNLIFDYTLLNCCQLKIIKRKLRNWCYITIWTYVIIKEKLDAIIYLINCEAYAAHFKLNTIIQSALLKALKRDGNFSIAQRYNRKF